jgi:hypothetical protein
LFKVVESSRNYLFEDDTPRAKVVSYALGAFKVCIDSTVAEIQLN